MDPEVKVEDIVVETPEPTLREQIETAAEAVETRNRDEQGRFAAKQAQEAADKPATEIQKPAVELGKPEAKPEIKPDAKPADTQKPTLAPHMWSAAAQAEFANASPVIKAEIARREADIHKEFTKQDGERQLGRQFRQIAEPYAAMIQAEGGNPVNAFKGYLETTRILRQGDPATKVQLVKQLCQQFGVNLEAVTNPDAPKIDPMVQNLHNELQQLKAERQQLAYQAQNQEQSKLQSQIEAFGADPANVHFEAVKPAMAALLSGGQAATLQEAYDQALWVRPDIRSGLLDQQIAAREAKRVADAKAKADAARRASGSVIGSPGLGASIDPQAGKRTLREELEANMASSRV